MIKTKMGNFDSLPAIMQEKFSSGPHGIALIFTAFQFPDMLELTCIHIARPGSL